MTEPLPFDSRTALAFARWVEATYPGPLQTLQPNCVDPKTDTQAFAGFLGGRFTILFPGTASLRDLFTDLKFRKTTWDGKRKTHAGATKAYLGVDDNSIHSQIVRAIKAAGVQSVQTGGHSLGGMLATACADALQRAGIEIASVYTFGSPRTGNREFADQYNTHLEAVTFRIWNAGDGVPCLPPRIPTFTSGIYRHVNREFYLNRDGGVSQNPWWMVHVAEILQSFRNPLRAFESFDHPIASYIQRLEALA